MFELPYDKYSKESIEQYSLGLIGKTFRDVVANDPRYTAEEKEKLFEDYKVSSSKGSLGNLIERHYFFYEPTPKRSPDLEEAGIEIKVSPFVVNKNNSLRAKERLVLTVIDYMEDYKDSFYDSHLYNKCALMLLIYYLHNSDSPRLDYVIKFTNLFKFPESDLEIIKNDYNVIINKIKAGKAHEISEGDTVYLGACTKGANKESVREQPFSALPAMQRAFCLKQSYMSYVLNNYIVGSTDTETLIKDSSILKSKSLEQYILEKTI